MAITVPLITAASFTVFAITTTWQFSRSIEAFRKDLADQLIQLEKTQDAKWFTLCETKNICIRTESP